MPGSRFKMPFVLFMFSLAQVAAFGDVTLPRPEGFVADHADIIDDATAERIAQRLDMLQSDTRSLVLVVTVPTTEGEDLASFAQRHFNDWKPRRTGIDDALIILAIKERRVRIHTGYALESILPDAWCAKVSREARDQFFREGNYAAGLEQMAVAVAGKIANPKVIAEAESSEGEDGELDPIQRSASSIGFVVALALLVLWVIVWRIRSGESLLALAGGGRSTSGHWGGRYGGGGYGGGSWGGGGGGFGGGFGGGSSGGGVEVRAGDLGKTPSADLTWQA